jgi:hypothetical protein
LSLTFNSDSGLAWCFGVFLMAGVGMGFVSLSTLLIVQGSVHESDLGIVTASNQFARTMGGTVGVGICGSFLMAHLLSVLKTTSGSDSVQLRLQLSELFAPEARGSLPAELLAPLQEALASGLGIVFAIVTGVAILCLGVCVLLPRTSE